VQVLAPPGVRFEGEADASRVLRGSDEMGRYGEKSGLVPGRRMRPDAYIEPGLPVSPGWGPVYLFHGNEWHMYPEGHPKHGGVNLHGVAYNKLYQKTLDDEAAYNAEGYRVSAVWEHEYGDGEKAKCPVHILKVVRGV